MSSKYVLVWLIYKCLLGYICVYWVFMVVVVIGMVVEVLVGYYFSKLMELLVNCGFVNFELCMVVILLLIILGLFVVCSVVIFVSDYVLVCIGCSVVCDLCE